MLRIQRFEQGKRVQFVLSGRIEAESLEELQHLVDGEEKGRSLILDLGEIKLVDGDAVRFLAQCEAAGATLDRCPAYVREWIERERAENRTPRRNPRRRRKSRR